MPTRSSRCQKWKKKTQNKKREKEEDKKSFFSGTFETNKIREEHLGFFFECKKEIFWRPESSIKPQNFFGFLSIAVMTKKKRRMWNARHIEWKIFMALRLHNEDTNLLCFSKQ